jgi:hypothetical protein
MQHLLFTAVAANGRAFDIEFPLHPQTRSSDAVSSLVTVLLEALSRALRQQQATSDGDLLQALAMTLAVRARILDMDPDSRRRLVGQLVATAMEAAQEAPGYRASRA